METSPVNGHFLSVRLSNLSPIEAQRNQLRTNVSSVDSLCGGFESEADILVPSLILGGDLTAD